MPTGIASTKGYSPENFAGMYTPLEDNIYELSFTSNKPYFSESGKYNSPMDLAMYNYYYPNQNNNSGNSGNNFGMKRSKIKVTPKESITINNKKYKPGNKMLINYEVLVLISIGEKEMVLSKGKKKIKYKISELI